MKLLFILFVALLTTGKQLIAQELVTIRDTINHYEIGIPVGWQYGVPTNKLLALVAYRKKQSELPNPRENFNINIIHGPEPNLEITYKAFVASIGTALNFKILSQKDTIINNTPYKQIIEQHHNQFSKEEMTHYILFTNKNGKVLILTLVTTSPNFPIFRNLYDKIAKSLKY